MSLKNHPDYPYERDRLAYTKHYIGKVIGATEENESKYQGNIKQAMIDLDHLDSSLSYINILTNAKFLEMTQRNFRQLQKIHHKPYFCRIDFKPEDADRVDKLYIGKTSLYREDDHAPIIVDWRSPIANLYYEGRIGQVSYDSGNGEIAGELALKRQYTIEDGELQDFRDIDITTRDELLQEALSQGADNRLSDIVSTIQEEQNRIIRAEMDQPLIVQGVAGSGKTTIALHRIAYFIYTYAQDFDPDSLMILAPNRLFINYISDVLPELGVEDIVQTTFIDFTYDCIGKKYKMIRPDDKLLTFINEEEQEENIHKRLEWVSQLKGSMTFKTMIDRYLSDLEQSFIPDTDVMLGKATIYPAKKIKKLFLEDYSYLPLYKRLDKIKKIISNHLRTKKKEILEKLEERFDNKIESVMFGEKDPQKRRKLVTKWMDAKEQKLNEYKSMARTLVTDYMKQFKKMDVFHYYQAFMEDELALQQYANEDIDKRQLNFLSEYASDLLNKKKIEIEDTAALLYMKEKIFGLDEAKKIKNVVIDEAQDFSVFQFFALKYVLKTNLFTLLGDVSQGTHGYRSFDNWQDVIDHVFPQANFMTLKQSYRTTVEIMELANAILKQRDHDELILAQPMVRHGAKPKWITFDQPKECIEDIYAQVQSLQSDGHTSITLIGRSMKECQQIERLMKKHTDLTSQLLKGDEPFETVDVLIVPSYIAKGLEFDVVFVVQLEETYEPMELDIKLLYVAMTRALHHLDVYSPKDRMPLLQNIPDDLMENVHVIK